MNTSDIRDFYDFKIYDHDRDRYPMAFTTEEGNNVWTDGCILVSIPGDEEWETYLDDSPAQSAVTERLASYPKDGWVKLVRPDAWRSEIWKVCPGCNGDGECECHCGDNHGCNECSGTGRVSPVPKKTRLHKGWGLVDLRRVQIALRFFPEVVEVNQRELSVGDKNAYQFWFRSDECMATVAGMEEADEIKGYWELAEP